MNRSLSQTKDVSQLSEYAASPETLPRQKRSPKMLAKKRCLTKMTCHRCAKAETDFRWGSDNRVHRPSVVVGSSKTLDFKKKKKKKNCFFPATVKSKQILKRASLPARLQRRRQLHVCDAVAREQRSRRSMVPLAKQQERQSNRTKRKKPTPIQKRANQKQTKTNKKKKATNPNKYLPPIDRLGQSGSKWVKKSPQLLAPLSLLSPCAHPIGNNYHARRPLYPRRLIYIP